jgi:hypothetical protein
MQHSLDAIAWAVCINLNPNIKYSPCHLAFNHDMLFCQAATVDWTAVNNERQKLLQASNTKENQSRDPKRYSPGDQVLIVLDADECRSEPKMSAPTKDPFTITRVHANATVDINHGNTTETINIRRIKPFYI